MTRHARNATAGTVYTYHERKKDTSSSGYGSDKIRLGKDSIKVIANILNSLFLDCMFYLFEFYFNILYCQRYKNVSKQVKLN